MVSTCNIIISIKANILANIHVRYADKNLIHYGLHEEQRRK
jgi:hypothetical protein